MVVKVEDSGLLFHQLSMVIDSGPGSDAGDSFTEFSQAFRRVGWGRRISAWCKYHILVSGARCWVPSQLHLFLLWFAVGNRLVLTRQRCLREDVCVKPWIATAEGSKRSTGEAEKKSRLDQEVDARWKIDEDRGVGLCFNVYGGG